MAQEHELLAENIVHGTAGSSAPNYAINEKDAGLWGLIKSKSVGYFRWTAFAMILAPIAFWIASRK